MTYTELLESEMESSERFTKENFGLQVGDGFPEMVREVLKSDKVAMKLIFGMILQNLSGKGIADSFKDLPEGTKPDFGQVVLKNVGAFDTPLALLYWGIQVGRKMERESAKQLNSLEQ